MLIKVTHCKNRRGNREYKLKEKDLWLEMNILANQFTWLLNMTGWFYELSHNGLEMIPLNRFEGKFNPILQHLFKLNSF